MLKKQKIKTVFDPDRWLDNLGDVCGVCREKVDLQNSIYLCRCPMLVHEQCFLKKFLSNIQSNQQIRCRDCGQQIRLEGKPRLSCDWRKMLSKKIIVPLLVAVISLAIICWLNYSGAYEPFFRKQIGFFIIAIATVVLLYAIYKNIVSKVYFLETLKVVKKQQEKFNKIGHARDLDDIESAQIDDILGGQDTERQIY